MSIAYDYGHETTPIAASRPKLLLIDGPKGALRKRTHLRDP